ncbi:hypothetical protein [Kribbella deserti]|uniref:Uncharacterized protein n=1 Tax=Kribbella deserti TaxID=1926257 RepID=A0ABV6QIL6_9ACTN
MTIHRLMAAFATEPVHLRRTDADAPSNASHPTPAHAAGSPPDDRPTVAAE